MEQKVSKMSCRGACSSKGLRLWAQLFFEGLVLLGAPKGLILRPESDVALGHYFNVAATQRFCDRNRFQQIVADDPLLAVFESK